MLLAFLPVHSLVSGLGLEIPRHPLPTDTRLTDPEIDLSLTGTAKSKILPLKHWTVVEWMSPTRCSGSVAKPGKREKHPRKHTPTRPEFEIAVSDARKMRYIAGADGHAGAGGHWKLVIVPEPPAGAPRLRRGKGQVRRPRIRVPDG